MSDSKIIKHVQLLSCLLDSGQAGYSKFRYSGIRPEDLDKNAAECLKFINEHYQTYKAPPTRDEFIHTFHEDLPPSSGTLEFWMDEVVKTKMTNLSHNMIQNFGLKWKEDIFGALDDVIESAHYIRRLHGTVDFVRAREKIEELRKQYLSFEAGTVGIPTPWETMDTWTQGWNPGDLCFLGARTGKGKTFFTILALIAAIKSKKVKRCLYASGEMPAISILQRYAVMDHKVSYEKLRKGGLSPNEKESYFRYLDDSFKELEQLFIFDNTKKEFSLENIGKAIEKCEADFVIVDAAYMLRLPKPLPPHEAMGKIAQGLKDQALRHRVSIIASTQLNRASLQKTSIDDSDFALSDQIAWNSDFMFILSQSDEQYQNREMQINPVKIREGVNTKKGLRISWNFDRMDFRELKENVTHMSDHQKKRKDVYDPNDPDDPTFNW